MNLVGVWGGRPAMMLRIIRESGRGGKGRRGNKMLYRLPNQQGVAEGMARYWCNGCQKSFIAEAAPEPEACPEGHLNPIPEHGKEPGS